jgi:hypothetical protein
LYIRAKSSNEPDRPFTEISKERLIRKIKPKTNRLSTAAKNRVRFTIKRKAVINSMIPNEMEKRGELPRSDQNAMSLDS